MTEGLMLGHEYARKSVQSHLETHMPAMLERIRTSLNVAQPINPRSILMADVLPDDPSLYPCVLVQATELTDITPTNAGPIDTDYLCEYSVTIVCASALHVLDDFVGASVNRDRMLLAARLALLAHPKLTAVAKAMVPSTLSERTGQSIKDLQGRPMAIGLLEFTVQVTEALLDDLGTITEHAVHVVGQPSTHP